MITAEELREVLKSNKYDMKVEDVEDALEEVDFNVNRKINYTEFLSATLNVQDFLKPEVNHKKL